MASDGGLILGRKAVGKRPLDVEGGSEGKQEEREEE